MRKLSNHPKISVIMAVYNGMPYLIKATKSILTQTYKNFEFIIVDDASTDQSWKYLKNLKDERIKLLKNTKNLGLSTSLNKTLQTAKGNYIARMDADDISFTERLEKQLKYMQSNQDVDLCGTWVKLINKQGVVIGEKKYPTKPEEVKQAITWYPAVIHPTFMAKNSFYKKMNGYRADYDFAEDYDLLSRAKNKFVIANLPEALIYWRLQDKRRSRKDMDKMDKLDLKIKIEALKRDGIKPQNLMAVLKKTITIYFIPNFIKHKLAIILKLA